MKTLHYTGFASTKMSIFVHAVRMNIQQLDLSSTKPNQNDLSGKNLRCWRDWGHEQICSCSICELAGVHHWYSLSPWIPRVVGVRWATLGASLLFDLPVWTRCVHFKQLKLKHPDHSVVLSEVQPIFHWYQTGRWPNQKQNKMYLTDVRRVHSDQH